MHDTTIIVLNAVVVVCGGRFFAEPWLIIRSNVRGVDRNICVSVDSLLFMPESKVKLSLN